MLKEAYATASAATKREDVHALSRHTDLQDIRRRGFAGRSREEEGSPGFALALMPRPAIKIKKKPWLC